jgi:hypothetical protein
LRNKAEDDKVRLSSKIRSPADKKKIRLAQEMREMMKSSSRKKFERENGIDTNVPSPVAAATNSSNVSKKMSFELVPLSIEEMERNEIATNPTTPSFRGAQRSDTPSSDVSLSEFEFERTDVAKLENNLEEIEMALVLQRNIRGYLCRLGPKLAEAREMAMKEAARVEQEQKDEEDRKAAAEVVASLAAEAALVAEAALIAAQKLAEEKRRDAIATKTILRRREAKARMSVEKASQAMIAKHFRGKKCQTQYQEFKSACLVVQTLFRKVAALRFVESVRVESMRRRRIEAIAKVCSSTTSCALRTTMSSWHDKIELLMTESKAATSIQSSWRVRN